MSIQTGFCASPAQASLLAEAGIPYLETSVGAICGWTDDELRENLARLADAGVKYGLPRDAAYLLASQTLSGTGRMQIETGMHPGAIKDGVCSPAGTTIRGVEALERAGLRAAMLDAIQATMER